MDCYTERAHLLALLACYFPAHLCPATDPEPGFTNVVCIHVTGTQCAWHIADTDLPLFAHLEWVPNHYDGHTTERKYELIAAHIEDMNS
jgi:hypothetical protein